MKIVSSAPRFPHLKKNQQRGSKPRCHLVTDGTKEEVAARLSSLITDYGEVTRSSSWMPCGFANCDEAQLRTAQRIIPDQSVREKLLNWWLAAPEPRSSTPNWDIASTCLVRGKPGVLLVEAKARVAELTYEEHGKKLGEKSSLGSRRNHIRIGACIEEASLALSDQTKRKWTLSRDRNYQMSNRFAWAWKLAELQIPVILVYLGFLNCTDMSEGVKSQNELLLSDAHWQELVEHHSSSLFPREIWNQEWQLHKQSFIPLIQTSNQQL